jgi:hypothetical protein
MIGRPPLIVEDLLHCFIIRQEQQEARLPKAPFSEA